MLALEEDLDRRAQEAHGIAVVELHESVSVLVENGSWIRSKLTLKAIQLVKESTPPLFASDGKVTVDHDGGELTINSTRVRAGGYYAFLPKKRYLVFLRSSVPGRIGFVGMQLKIDSNDRIAPTDLSSGQVATAGSSFYGLPVKTVISEFKRRQQQ